jgi:hypothetical protein
MLYPDVMAPWHVVMGKAEYGHNAGNELRRVRHYLGAQEQKCDGNDCTVLQAKIYDQRWRKGTRDYASALGKGRMVMVETRANWACAPRAITDGNR